MSKMNRTLKAAIICSAFAISAPRSSLALVPRNIQRAALTDSSASGRPQWVIQSGGDSAGQRIEVRERVPHKMMVFRFRVEVSALRADEESLASPKWVATLYIVRHNSRTVLPLTTDAPDLTFPKPLGVELSAGDSVILTVEMERPESRTRVARITIGHDPLDSPTARVGIRPFGANVGSAGDSLVVTWKNDVNGRLMVVTGVLCPSVAEMHLLDVTTGAILWSNSATGRAGFDASNPVGVQWFGVSLIAGHEYRLTVSHRRNGTVGANLPAVTAMVRPSVNR